MRRTAWSERGFALIGVLVALVLLMGFTAIMRVSVDRDTQILGAFARGVLGFYAAEAGLNKGMADAKNLFLDFRLPQGADLSEKTFSLGNRTVAYQLTERPGNPLIITIPAGDLFAGLNAIQYTYVADSKSLLWDTAEASVGAEFNVNNIPIFQFVAFYKEDLEIAPGPQMILNGRVHTNGDLYLNANSTLSISDNPGAGVDTIQVTTAGDIYRGRKNNTASCGGTVIVDKLEDVVAPFPDLDPKTLPCGGGTRKVLGPELTGWKGSMMNQVQSINIPEPDIIARGSGEFWKKADLRLALVLSVSGRLCASCPQLSHSIAVLAADQSIDTVKTARLVDFMRDVVWNQANSSMPDTMPIFYTDVPILNGGGCGCSIGSSNQSGCRANRRTCYADPFASNNRVYNSDMRQGGKFTDPRRGGFYNYREKKWMYLLNINMADLIAWNGANGEPFFSNADRSDGGLVVFATVIGPVSGQFSNYGVRVFGSRDLPIPYDAVDPTGLTVVTDQGIYVAGDYNRGREDLGDLPKQPAALIGDSVNVLSNAWIRTGCNGGCNFNDDQSRNKTTTGDRAAQDTWVNAAFLGGVDRTGGVDGAGGQNGSYNGGLENYPRFHERWSGKALNYQGSFVSLGIPEHAHGGWKYGNPVYQAPKRNWNFDPDFNRVERLPPLTPRFVYVRQVLFTQNFR